MTSLDIESIEALDFDFAPPCEAKRHKGDAPAVWRLKFTICCETKRNRPVILFCDPCFQRKLGNHSLRCIYCGTVWLPPLSAYRSIIRID